MGFEWDERKNQECIQKRGIRMKDKSTLVKYTREELEHVPDETDWEKVDTMSDEEVYQDALSDKDAQPTDKTFWETAPLPSHLVKRRIQ